MTRSSRSPRGPLFEQQWFHEAPQWKEYAQAFTSDPIPEGPWDGEPDKAQWVDAATGLDCLAVRNHYGAWCGYVGLPSTHPLYGTHYSDVTVTVHGGELTFSERCNEEAPEGYGICHIPLPGRPDDVWWLGFDCGHYMDLQPGLAALLESLPDRPTVPGSGMFTLVYRTLEYVQRECERLAKQLAEVR